MSELARGIVIAAVILGGSLVVRDLYGSHRWQLQPAVGGAVYRLDSVSGNVGFCTPLFCRPLPNLVPDQAQHKTSPSAPAKRPPLPGSAAPKAPSTGT